MPLPSSGNLKLAVSFGEGSVKWPLSVYNSNGSGR